jgi:hypothetical protein
MLLDETGKFQTTVQRTVLQIYLHSSHISQEFSSFGRQVKDIPPHMICVYMCLYVTIYRYVSKRYEINKFFMVFPCKMDFPPLLLFGLKIN